MKALEHICEMDPRYASVLSDVKPVKSNIVSLQITVSWGKEQHYELLSSLVLPEYVPEKIRNQIDIALNTAMYAWFTWELWDVAAHKAVDCYELGLREALAPHLEARNDKIARRKRAEGKSLKPSDSLIKMGDLIGMAKARGLLTDDEYNRSEGLRGLRNNFSHAYSSLLGNWALDILRECAELIVNIHSRPIGTGAAASVSDNESQS